jgi:hypothetical protein
MDGRCGPGHDDEERDDLHLGATHAVTSGVVLVTCAVAWVTFAVPRFSFARPSAPKGHLKRSAVL